MAKIQIFSAKGVKTGNYDLARDFSVSANMNLLAQAIHVYEDRTHKGTSKVKTRSEVSLTGAKMYKQKGTGRARHGDAKAPIFVGGGIAHGPKGVKRILNLSTKLKKRALKMALDLKVKEERIVIADKLEVIKKTKDANQFLVSISKEFEGKSNNILVVVASDKKEAFRNFRNIKNVHVSAWNNLNAYDIFKSSFLIIDKDALSNTKKAPSPLPKTTLEASVKIASPKKTLKKAVISKKKVPSKVKPAAKKKVKKS